MLLVVDSPGQARIVFAGDMGTLSHRIEETPGGAFWPNITLGQFGIEVKYFSGQWTFIPWCAVQQFDFAPDE